MVLLGSIASGKYVEALLPIFGERLLFPPAFIGRGDMSRGGLMLRCAASGEELDYIPVAGAIRQGRRPPRLDPATRVPRPEPGGLGYFVALRIAAETRRRGGAAPAAPPFGRLQDRAAPHHEPGQVARGLWMRAALPSRAKRHGRGCLSSCSPCPRAPVVAVASVSSVSNKQ